MWCHLTLTDCLTVVYTTLHLSLHYNTLHYTTLHYTTLHYTTHFTTIHYTTLHYPLHKPAALASIPISWRSSIQVQVLQFNIGWPSWFLFSTKKSFKLSDSFYMLSDILLLWVNINFVPCSPPPLEPPPPSPFYWFNLSLHSFACLAWVVSLVLSSAVHWVQCPAVQCTVVQGLD